MIFRIDLIIVRISPKYSTRQYRHISGVTIYDVLYFMTLKVQNKTHFYLSFMAFKGESNFSNNSNLITSINHCRYKLYEIGSQQLLRYQMHVLKSFYAPYVS